MAAVSRQCTARGILSGEGCQRPAPLAWKVPPWHELDLVPFHWPGAEIMMEG
jgi:hypothetical protein